MEFNIQPILETEKVILYLKDTGFKNRIITFPMCMYSAEGEFANNWHQVHYDVSSFAGI